MAPSGKAKRLHLRDESPASEPEYKPMYGTKIKRTRVNVFHIEGYPDMNEPLPNGLDNSFIIQHYPNHLRDGVLYRIYKGGYNGKDINELCRAIGKGRIDKRIEYVRKIYDPDYFPHLKKRKLEDAEAETSARRDYVKKARDGLTKAQAIDLDEESNDEFAIPALQHSYPRHPVSGYSSTRSPTSYLSSSGTSQSPFTTPPSSFYTPSPPAPVPARLPAGSYPSGPYSAEYYGQSIGPRSAGHNAQPTGRYSASHDDFLRFQTDVLNEVHTKDPKFDSQHRSHISIWARAPERQIERASVYEAANRVNARNAEQRLREQGLDPEEYRERLVPTENGFKSEWVLK